MERKHAFMIGCYKCPEYLESLIDSLDGRRSNFYIHVNKENVEEFESLRLKMKNRNNVLFVPSIKVIWGGMTLLKSLCIMMNEAIKNEDNFFFHFLTGQDALVQPLDKLYDFFDSNSDKNFVSISKNIDTVLCPKSKELDWIQYYHTYDRLNYRTSFFSKTVEKMFVGIQKIFGFKRKLSWEKYYKGSGWFSLNKKAVQILLDAMNNKEEMKKWNNCFATEEIFIPTILKNSTYNLNIVNDSLRYIDWKKGPTYPAILDESSFDDIIYSGKFFCRKIDPNKSKKLLQMLYCVRHDTKI